MLDIQMMGCFYSRGVCLFQSVGGLLLHLVTVRVCLGVVLITDKGR